MRSERGTFTVMTIGFLVFLGLLVVVVVNSSAAFLQRQQLDNVADGAARGAADGLSTDTFYRTGALTLDGPAARRLVGEYVRDPDVRVVQVRSDANQVHVRLERSVALAIAPPGWNPRTTIVSEATAQLRPTP